MLRRSWPFVRLLLGLAVVALAVWVLSAHTDELSGLPGVFEKLNWWWLSAAVAAEVLSFVSFAAMQRWLLKVGGLGAPMAPLLKMSFASQAIANSLPGGNAVSAVYGFRWFRRFGASNTLAAWAMVGTVIASIVSLALVATLGLVLATEEGASLDLIPAIIGALVVTTAIGALFVYERPFLIVLTSFMRLSRSITGRPKGDTEARFKKSLLWITSVQLGWRQVAVTLLWGAANWLFDCACFAMMFLAIGTVIPWKGLLLAYGAGQLAAALPITPGGLGVVEGSITIALVAFGGAETTTVDAVLLYRLISFWLVLAVGWALWGELAFEVRKGRWDRDALSARVEAGRISHALPDPVSTAASTAPSEELLEEPLEAGP
jgi:uncharacterized protein (TIRG00374 family)